MESLPDIMKLEPAIFPVDSMNMLVKQELVEENTSEWSMKEEATQAGVSMSCPVNQEFAAAHSLKQEVVHDEEKFHAMSAKVEPSEEFQIEEHGIGLGEGSSSKRVRRRGQVIHSKEREIIRNVVICCDKEAKEMQLSVPIQRVTERAMFYTAVSKSIICGIRKRIREEPGAAMVNPRRQMRTSAKKAFVDDFARRVIHQTIEDFYVVQKIVPTLRRLLPTIKERIHFPWGKDVLQRILHEMGFSWKRSVNNRVILLERRDIVDWRCRYLTEIRKFRTEQRNVFFVDETWVDSSLTFRKYWQGPAVKGVLDTVNANNRFILVNIGSINGFLPGAQLLYEPGTVSGQINSENFQKWLATKVIPYLPNSSVIVMDNAPYHSKEHNRAPSKYATKKEMIDWLQTNGVSADMSKRKTYLYEQIVLKKPKAKIFEVDLLLKGHGHTALRLPPYMCDLNPIEQARLEMKCYVRQQIVSGDNNMTKLQSLVLDGLQTITADDWKGYCTHVEELENGYWTRDGNMEDAIDKIIVHLNEIDDSSDSEDEFISLADESDSDLAVV